MENSLSVFTLVAGLVACVLGFLAYQHVSGAWTHVGATWLGLITLIVGLPAQLYSATRTERMLIVTGLVAAFVGGALAIAHGGVPMYARRLGAGERTAFELVGDFLGPSEREANRFNADAFRALRQDVAAILQ